MTSPFKILFFDIEILQTTLGDAWKTMGAANSNMICFGYKWAHQKKAKVLTLEDTGEFPGMDPFSPVTDRELVTKAHEIMSQADILVGHYSDKFDWKYLHAKFAKYRLPDLKHIEKRDTCMVARRNLKLGSNRLDAVAQFFGTERKQSIDYQHWLAVWAGNAKSLRLIAKYCKQDVVTLEGVYYRMENLFRVDQHAGAALGHGRCSCPHCGSENTHAKANKYTATGMAKKQMHCQNCGKYFRVALTTYAKERG